MENGKRATRMQECSSEAIVTSPNIGGKTAKDAKYIVERTQIAKGELDSKNRS